jgi:hypoxanthine phosphoribosyltransferase
VLRESYKSYMGDALSEETLSITTGSPQTLYLDEKDQRLLRGKAVVLLDDVVTTGSTFGGMRALIEKVDAHVVCEAAVFTEGDPERWAPWSRSVTCPSSLGERASRRANLLAARHYDAGPPAWRSSAEWRLDRLDIEPAARD